MALYAPLALLAFPAVALVVIFGAFACFFEASEEHGWRDALMTSGSSLFTLGFERPPGLGSAFIAFTEAAIGLGAARGADRVPADDLQLVLAARDRWSPTSRCARARRRPRGSALELAHRAGFLNEIDPVWDEWMQWFSRGLRRRTRRSARSRSSGRRTRIARGSPRPGTVLDAAALRLAVLEHPVHARARRCASGRASWRCARSPASSASTTTPTRRPTTRSASPRDEFIEIYERARRRGPSRCGPTASRRGATSRAGASTTTGCCSRCAAW